jgi:hypothetical protein
MRYGKLMVFAVTLGSLLGIMVIGLNGCEYGDSKNNTVEVGGEFSVSSTSFSGNYVVQSRKMSDGHDYFIGFHTGNGGRAMAMIHAVGCAKCNPPQK